MSRKNVSLINYTPNPASTAYMAMRQDHNSEMIVTPEHPSGREVMEAEADEIVSRLCVDVNKTHYGVLEHIYLNFGIYQYPSYALNQLRTHRHVTFEPTFDVQSFRYTGSDIEFVAADLQEKIDNSAWLRASLVAAGTTWMGPGWAKKSLDYIYEKTGEQVSQVFFNPDPTYSNKHSDALANFAFLQQLLHYRELRKSGMRKENARSVLGQGVRQNAICSMNLRSLLHLGSVRLSGDAQDVTTQLVQEMIAEVEPLLPNIMQSFLNKEPKKLMLSP
jgi:thymidylate synthase ThyX